jgi:hypothetical protein
VKSSGEKLAPSNNLLGPSYFVPIQVDVLKVNNPFLLGLNDMKSMKMLIDVEAMAWKVDGSPELPLLEKDKHIWLRIPSTDSSCFTKSELHQLHNRMGHPQAERLLKFLKLSAADQLDDETKRIYSQLLIKVRPVRELDIIPTCSKLQYQMILCSDMNY